MRLAEYQCTSTILRSLQQHTQHIYMSIDMLYKCAVKKEFLLACYCCCVLLFSGASTLSLSMSVIMKSINACVNKRETDYERERERQTISNNNNNNNNKTTTTAGI